MERGLRDALMVLGHKARSKSVSVNIDVAPNVPRVRALGGELNQIWANIIDNAIDAVNPAGHVTIKIATTGDKRSVVVRIIDDGPGIPRERIEEVIARGTRLDRTVPGTGIGLAIVHDLVELHRGSLELSQSPSSGVRVTLRLPGDQATA